jgi:iron complex outermembrane receptor protein
VVPVAPGNALPGVPKHSLFAELSWRAPRPTALGLPIAALEVRRVSQVFVDDRNSDAAAGYTVAGIRAGFEKRVGDWTVNAFARIDNLADVRYAGSVIVNEANGRFFETAPGRNWTLGATLAYRIRP